MAREKGEPPFCFFFYFQKAFYSDSMVESLHWPEFSLFCASYIPSAFKSIHMQNLPGPTPYTFSSFIFFFIFFVGFFFEYIFFCIIYFFRWEHCVPQLLFFRKSRPFLILGKYNDHCYPV